MEKEYEVTMEAKTVLYIIAESEEEATEQAYEHIWEEVKDAIRDFEVTDVAEVEWLKNESKRINWRT